MVHEMLMLLLMLLMLMLMINLGLIVLDFTVDTAYMQFLYHSMTNLWWKLDVAMIYHKLSNGQNTFC